MNGQTSALLSRDGQAFAVLTVNASEQGIDQVLWMMNPAKLTAVSIPPDAAATRAGLMIPHRPRRPWGSPTPPRQAAHHAARRMARLRAQVPPRMAEGGAAAPSTGDRPRPAS
ncbi:hypothetical protein [Nonomuraea dietziae]|uniref:hypothetical protein n=1 Tax=Nonomuraea dietziae TaxID=65515 RepID=UPI0031E1893C